MWSGGDTTATAATTPSTDPKVLRQEYDTASAEAAQRQREQDLEGVKHGNAAEHLQQCNSDFGLARQDEADWTQRARSSHDAVTSAEDAQRQSEHQTKGEWDALVPERMRAASDRNLAYFYDSRYFQDYADQITKGIMEKICEDNNWGGCAILSFFKACLRMLAATLGVSSSIAVELSLFSYFKVPDLLRNQGPDQHARAKAEEDGIRSREDALRKKGEDNRGYFDQLVADKKAKETADAAKLADAERATGRARKKVDDAKVKRDDARDKYHGVAQEAREASERARAASSALNSAIEEKKGAGGGTVKGGGGGGGGKRATAAQKQKATTRLGEVGISGASSDPVVIAIAGLSDAEWAKAKQRFGQLNSTGQSRVKANPQSLPAIGKMSDADWSTTKGQLETTQPPPQQQEPTQQQKDASAKVQRLAQRSFNPASISPAVAAEIMAAADNKEAVEAILTKHNLL